MFKTFKDNHLRKYLENEYGVDIFKKYGAYLIVKNGIIIDFFFTIDEVHSFLENNPEYMDILCENGIPEKLLKKWEKRQLTDEDLGDDLPEDKEEDEPKE